jgi:hypothetical protein
LLTFQSCSPHHRYNRNRRNAFASSSFSKKYAVSFELAQDDPAAFYIILAIASADRSILRDEKEPLQALAHNTYSIRMLNKRISDVENATTARTITTAALQIIFLVALPLSI